MRKTIFVLSLLYLGASSATQAQQSREVQQLNQRMDSLEGKLDKLIDAMSKQTSAPQAAAPSSGTSVTSQPASFSAPDGYNQGMNLDVFASGLAISQRDPDPKIEIPSDLPNGSVAVKAQNVLNYGEFLDFKETAPLSKVTDSLVGVSYNGYLSIDKRGDHTFQLITRSPGRTACITQLYLNRNKVISKYNDQSPSSSSQSKISLTPGLYQYQTFLLCGIYRGSNKFYYSFEDREFGGVTLAFSMAEPGDRALHPVPTEKLLIKQ